MLVDPAQMRQAIEGGELVPFFQPVVELRTGQLAGFEVLARWQHPKLGLVLPDHFIPLAQENGLLGQFMLQILRSAFVSGLILPDPLTLAVNVSPVQLYDLTLPAVMRVLAEQSGFPLNRVVIEITETALFNNLERARRVAQELKDMGCRLALDDFGTGYSSMSHLQALPFDQLKIDRSFVEDMAKSRENRKIAAAIVGLGHSLGLHTVAEGVETKDQATILLWLGCEQGQGWLYGRPLPAEALSAFLATPPLVVTTVPSPGAGWAISSLEALPNQRLAQLQAIYDGAPVGLCFLDQDLRYVSINQRLAEINGPPVAAHLGKTVKEMIPESYPSLEPYLLRALRGEAISELEISRPSIVPGGPGRTVRVSYQPAWDETGEVIGISIAVVDITEQKMAEQALVESEHLRRHMAEVNARVPWMMDAGGNSLQVSSRWILTEEGVRERMQSLGWLEGLHHDDLVRAIEAIKDAMKSGQPIDIEYRVKTIEGEWKWVRSRGSPRFGPSGEITHWSGIVEDIEERKSTEVDLNHP